MSASIRKILEKFKCGEQVCIKSDTNIIKFVTRFMKISGIYIYPIKSLKGILLENSLVEKRGLQFDRRWMLVDENGEFFTQREFPKMATVSIKLQDDSLKISAEGFEDLSVPFETAGETVKVRVWQSVCDAIASANHINKWFSEVLQTNCRLVFMPDESEREVNAMFNKNRDIVSFADGYPLLVIGENSLNDLNEKLADKIPMNRFRPNLIVSGSAPFAEDLWEKIKIGETVFRSSKPCVRCVMTTIDQKAGVFTGKEPLKTLASYRMAKDVFPGNYAEFGLEKTGVLFGQNLIAENFGETVKIGDEIGTQAGSAGGSPARLR